VQQLLARSKSQLSDIDISTDERYRANDLGSSSSEARRVKTEAEKALIRLALHRSSFFTCLDEEQIERFVQVAELREFPGDEAIIKEGYFYDNDDGNEPLLLVNPNESENEIMEQILMDEHSTDTNANLSADKPLDDTMEGEEWAEMEEYEEDDIKSMDTIEEPANTVSISNDVVPGVSKQSQSDKVNNTKQTSTLTRYPSGPSPASYNKILYDIVC